MQNMWNYGYALTEKTMAKNGNEWFIINTVPSGPTDQADREFGLELFKLYRGSQATMVYDFDDSAAADAYSSGPAPDLDKSEF